MKMTLRSMGTIRTPYPDKAPYQPEPDAQGLFYIELDESLREGLLKLVSFRYI